MTTSRRGMPRANVTARSTTRTTGTRRSVPRSSAFWIFRSSTGQSTSARSGFDVPCSTFSKIAPAHAQLVDEPNQVLEPRPARPLSVEAVYRDGDLPVTEMREFEARAAPIPHVDVHEPRDRRVDRRRSLLDRQCSQHPLDPDLALLGPHRSCLAGTLSVADRQQTRKGGARARGSVRPPPATPRGAIAYATSELRFVATPSASWTRM